MDTQSISHRSAAGSAASWARGWSLMFVGIVAISACASFLLSADRAHQTESAQFVHDVQATHASTPAPATTAVVRN